MSRVIVQSLEGGIQHAFTLSNEFVKVCPGELWGKKFAAWPVWQQLFHPFAVVDFFLRPAGAAEEPPLFQPGVAELTHSPLETPAKLLVQEFMEKAQQRVLAFAATLDDASLGLKHEGLSSRIGREFTNAGVLTLIASHTMYHLGCCDAALREQGLPGVF